jgi:hypothetical protein
MPALLGHIAAIGDERVHAAGFAVTLLDFDVPAMIGMLQSNTLLDAAKARSKSKGVHYQLLLHVIENANECRTQILIFSITYCAKTHIGSRKYLVLYK